MIYRLRQDNRRVSKYPGKWFAHAVNLRTVDTDEVARIIERNCSVKRSDVLAVITELGDVMRQLLSESHRVKLKGIGSFMTSITGTPCDHPVKYGPKYIKGVKLNFKADKEMDFSDVRFEALPYNGVKIKE